jgi:hypothetical protein
LLADLHTMASRPRRALVVDTFHEEMQRPTTTSRDHKAKLKKAQEGTVHIRPECESIYCAGTELEGTTSQEEQKTSENMHQALMKTWDSRMTNLEGEFVMK